MKANENKVKGCKVTKKCIVLLVVLLLLAPAASATDTRYEFQSSDWARKDVEKAIALGLDLYSYGGDYRKPIKRSEFAENAASLVAVEFGSKMESYLMIMNYRRLAVNDDDFLLNAVDIAKNLGIIKGRKHGDWDEYSYITRQEAAVMLARTYRAYHDDVPDLITPLFFTDQNDIASWAMDDVQLINQLGIMTGDKKGRFNPKGSYTKEQCLVTLLRLHEKCPYDGFKQENPFTIPVWEGGFQKVWDDGSFVFAIETKEYYIFSCMQTASIHAPVYYIKIIDQNLSLRLYCTAIITSSYNYYGETYARPENPAISKDGTKLLYTATVTEDAYEYNESGAKSKLLFPKGIYHVTMDLKTGKQTYTRDDLK